jgi:tryptophan halogenase
VLRDLGIGHERLEAAGALRCTGTAAAWGAAETQQRDAIYDPHGHGWHLDRPRFDEVLRDEARAAGADVRAGRVAAHPTSDGPRVAVGRAEIGCRWLVDATGRRATVARSLGARRERADRLVAVYAALRTAPGDVDARTRVEAMPSGWWYSALVADRRRIVARLADADLLDPELRTAIGFARALARTRHILPVSDPERGSSVAHGATHVPHAPRALAGPVAAQVLAGPVAPQRRAEPLAPQVLAGPLTTAAHGARLRPPVGDRWVAVGDAALAFDPLSSQGILNALATGIAGAGAVAARLGGDADDESYERALERIWTAYEINRAGAYAAEDRWTQEPFWARRRQDASRSDLPAYSPAGWRTT